MIQTTNKVQTDHQRLVLARSIITSYSYVSHICSEGDTVQLTSKFTETLVATLLCALTHFTDNSHDVLEYTRNARVLEHTYKYLHVL